MRERLQAMTPTSGHAEVARQAIALYGEFELDGNLEHLHTAITMFRQALDATPTDHRDRVGMLSNFGAALQTRFDYIGQPDDLDEAIRVGQQAVDATPADHPYRSAMLSNLGAALTIRFLHIGELSDLDEAIRVGRQAVADTPTENPGLSAMLSNLGATLHTRFERVGQLADLDEAIRVGQQAVADTPTDDPDRPIYLSGLGNALRSRFERVGQLADLDEAIRVGQQAIGTSTKHPGRSAMLSNLATSLQIRFSRTGQPGDLDEAIRVGQQAVDTTSTDHPYRSAMLSNLATSLQIRFDNTGQLADLDEAIRVGQQAVDTTSTDHPDRPIYLSGLGNALRSRFDRTARQHDRDQAMGAYREGAAVKSASPGHRLTAAHRWGRCAAQAGDASGAARAYAAAIELLPQLVWHGLDQPTREHHLREHSGLVPEATTAAIAAGDACLAVKLLEAGRGQLWTQALHLRHDLAELRSRDGDLANALDDARKVLNSAADRPGTLLPDVLAGGDSARVAEQHRLDQRRQAAHNWDTAVGQARRIVGFEDFLRPVPFAELRPAADGGAVVIVNVSRHGSHALILTPGAGPGVQVLDLPTATFDAVFENARTLLSAWQRTGDPTVDPTTREEDRHAVFDVLDWTWRAITEPVLAVLGDTQTPEGNLELWPRLWWCPTGPATMLPLHAAGLHPRTGIQYGRLGEAAAIANTVAGRVVSSYTPTLTALTRARTRSAPGLVRQLAVGVPDALGQTPLHGVPRELDVLASHLPVPDRAKHLLGPDATRDAVLTLLPSHQWLHLSCHGSQNPVDASRSAFLLHDTPLTLADLSALNLPDADLAYLAACQTATGDIRLFDEALHLAAALQLIGYRHVLAALWNVSDAVAPDMAGLIYAHLAHPDQPQAVRAPYALHHAVTRLRQGNPGQPLLWAPYIHLGP